MRPEVEERLLQLSAEFYQTFAAAFADSRARLQPGVLRALQTVEPQDDVLDLGCGHGGVARALAGRNHEGTYVGVDQSQPLLELARAGGRPARSQFIALNLADPGWSSAVGDGFDAIFAFALLHHIPGQERRRAWARECASLLKEDGGLVLSTWDFLQSPRLQERIQPWDQVGLTAADVDPGDYLLDWRREGWGLRYVHHFTPAELAELASSAELEVVETYRSDGEGGRLGLYQIWKG